MTPLPAPPGRRARLAGYAFSAAVVLSLLSAVVVFPQLSPAKAEKPPDIVDLQFARWNGEQAAGRIVDRWRAGCLLGLARINNYYDYAFIVFYTVAFYYGVRLAATAFPGGAGFGRWLACGMIVAGLCDGVENVFLLRMLADDATAADIAAAAPWATGFATAKYLLLVAGSTCIVTAACEPLRRRVERL